MQRTDKTGIVRIVNDREHLDLETFRLEDDFRACDGHFAEPAVAKATANHDALGLLPWLGF